MLNSAFKIPLPAIALYIGTAALFDREGIAQQKNNMVIGFTGAFGRLRKMPFVNLKLLNLLMKTVNYSTKATQINHTLI